MTKDEEAKILDELGIEKSPSIGKCGTLVECLILILK